MTAIKDDSLYLEKYSNYAKQDVKWENQGPRDIFDYRERVRRETVRGKTTFFHSNIEDYIQRQARGYTVPRVGLHFAVAALLTYQGTIYNVL